MQGLPKMPKLISNDAPGSHGRHTRLMRVMSSCQSFCCLSEEPDDQGVRLARFNRSIIQLEDDRGVLNVLWESEEDRYEFSDLLQLSWQFQLEGGRVNHSIYLTL